MPDARATLLSYLKTAQLFGEEELLLCQDKGEFISSFPIASSIQLKTQLQDRKAALEHLYQKYADCQRCPLSKSRKKIVFGMGSLYPRVVFIGEGPGYEEDRAGLPFVGKAGELLDRILKAIGLDRKSVYITNIVKCHPLRDPLQRDTRGNDRPPSFFEVEACREILEAQIKILNPPLICALGTTAARALLKTEAGITHLRGKVHSLKIPGSSRSIPLVPTYHPAAVLRNESLKKEVWQDMKLLLKELQHCNIAD